MSTRMNRITYYGERARHYLALAHDAKDLKLRETYESVARDFLSKAAKADVRASVHLVDGLEHPLH